MTYTKEQKKEYFNSLRERWAKNKELAENDTTARGQYEAMSKESEKGFSYYGFYFALLSMRANGFEGLPYIDAKTFQGWKKAGFIVKKGAKSRIEGITWLEVGESKDKDGQKNDDGYLLPKMYHLFHRSQVEELKA